MFTRLDLKGCDDYGVAQVKSIVLLFSIVHVSLLMLYVNQCVFQRERERFTYLPDALLMKSYRKTISFH